MVRKLIRNRLEPEIFTLNCPTQQILDIIANKWSVIVLYCLAYKPRRYKQLERKIEGISQKVLTQTLRRLIKNGLVERKVYPVAPPQVEYSLTPLGETLIEPLAMLAEWSEANFAAIEIARQSQQEK
ncbi:MAG: helix-turn-helix domain-containing protein [Xenococcaceae cyanobacterium MO_207.B15]|nr:helix-turn-helix domain-containing protein [Xenococcaceae cyanobacterium MO_207.B15]